MRAFREANTNTGVDILLQSEYDALMEKDPKVMYITYALASDLDTTACTLVIANVYVGTQEHDVLVNNAGIIIWQREEFIQMETPTPYQTRNYTENLNIPYSGTLPYSIDGFDSAGAATTYTGSLPYSGSVPYVVNVDFPLASFYNLAIPLHQLV